MANKYINILLNAKSLHNIIQLDTKTAKTPHKASHKPIKTDFTKIESAMSAGFNQHSRTFSWSMHESFQLFVQEYNYACGDFNLTPEQKM